MKDFAFIHASIRIIQRRKGVGALLMLISALSALAEERAEVVVSYDCTVPAFGGGVKTNKMTLLANTGISKFFNDMSLWTDSLKSTPAGEAKYMEILRASCLKRHPDGYEYWDLTQGPVKKIYTYIFNDNASRTLTVYDRFGEETMTYVEPAEEMSWNLPVDSVTNILGYDCVMAETDYHGRHWKAWFAPEIPVVAGPWKLRGLPGLILKAESEGGFSFVATGLEPTDRLITPMYSPGDYKTTDRKNALKMNEYYFNNQEAIIKAQNGGEGKITYQDDQGNEIAAPKYDGKKLSLEPDYK